ncbi:MAG: GMC family oxidoreductase N-terminal domain-containing protein [Saccharospirillum sp.]|nr:GMC family oxidoreductase N-terminal domain-containing protein [Saccharospirillum sp.]
MANAYLRHALCRENRVLRMHALTTRILLEGIRVTGVEYWQGGQLIKVQARREVILSASAFNSPKLLILWC